MTTLIRGVDCSHFQGSGTAQHAVVGWGARFAWIKVSQGWHGRDYRAPMHYAEFGARGCPRGPYHFYDPSVSPMANAGALCDAAEAIGRWELPSALDCEAGHFGDQHRAAAEILQAAQLVEQRLGRPPVIYAGGFWWRPEVGSAGGAFAGYVLWLPEYPGAYAHPDPTPPAQITARAIPPWSRVTVWQFSDGGGDLDRNVMADADLATLLGAAPPPGPVPDPEEAEIMAAKDEIIQAIQGGAEVVIAAVDGHLMAKPLAVRDETGRVWVIGAMGRWQVPDQTTMDVLRFLGMVMLGPDGRPSPIKFAQIAGLPILAHG